MQMAKMQFSLGVAEISAARRYDPQGTQGVIVRHLNGVVVAGMQGARPGIPIAPAIAWMMVDPAFCMDGPSRLC